MLKKHRTNDSFEQVRENLWGSYSWFQVVPPLHLFSILRRKRSALVQLEVVGNPAKRVIVTDNGANCLQYGSHLVSTYTPINRHMF